MIAKIYNTILSNSYLKVVLSCTILVFVASLYHRYIQQDEPWFGEQAYWLVKEGNVKIKSMPGIFNWTSNMIIYHKLVVWLGAAIIFLFGWSVYYFKLLILLFFTTTAYFIYRFLKVKMNTGDAVAFLAVTLFFITPELIHRGFIYRPEVMVMCFGFLSFYFIYDYRSAPRLLLGGLFAGLAFLSHLNGMIFPVAGFIYLLIQKQWKPLMLFAPVAFLVSMIYTIGLWNQESIETYMFQLKNWPTHQDTFSSKVDGNILDTVFSHIKRILGEHKRYFWDQDVWGISGLFIVSMLVSFRRNKKNYPALMTYTLILLISIAVLTSSHSPRYLVALMPFMVMTFAVTIFSINDMKKGKSAIAALFTLMVAAQIAFASMAYSKIFKTNHDHVQKHAQVLSSIEKGKNILAPWSMIYNQIDEYNFFSFKTYEYIEDQNNIKLSQIDLLEQAHDKYLIDYIIVNTIRKHDKEFPWFKNWQLEPNPFYKEIKRNEDFLILKRI
ncbi:glycosyltransferase family 39 protein [Fulvivirga sp.]|uniref:ArnT family glycosyltransferase n=1 Tax=Fulvivirga sp. TaxID=1931237 RepID=UPI0032EC0980